MEGKRKRETVEEMRRWKSRERRGESDEKIGKEGSIMRERKENKEKERRRNNLCVKKIADYIYLFAIMNQSYRKKLMFQCPFWLLDNTSVLFNI